MRIYENNVKLSDFAGEGAYNDPDFLVVGMPGVTIEQSRAQFSLWCVMTAPLMIAADVRNISEDALKILRNKKAIAVN